MSINAHRIKKIVYASSPTFRSGSNLSLAIEHNPETNDFRNNQEAGVIEIPLRALKKILKEAKKNNLEDYEIEVLKKEIAQLEKEGKDNDDYIEYDMF